MTNLNDAIVGNTNLELAQNHFEHLMLKLIGLYTSGECSSLSEFELESLGRSLSFLLGFHRMDEPEAMAMLANEEPESLFSRKQRELRTMVDESVALCERISELMPPIRNISLRDTLDSILNIRKTYDTYFAAHEMPCSIDYQLSVPVDEALQGVDYVRSWLEQLYAETCFIAQFDADDCIAHLERICPDYRGLHVNLYDLLVPYAGVLKQSGSN